MAPHTPQPADSLPLTPIALEILLALGNGDRHGYDIMVAIEERTAGRLSPNPGTLYRAIDRLAREGLIQPSPQRPARTGPRRFYRLSPLGLRVAAAELERLADQVQAAQRTRLIKVAGSR